MKEAASSGVLHNIDDEGLPVKGFSKMQTDTLQFKRWFGKSKAVDEEGRPLVVYHGSQYGGHTIFDVDYARSERGIWLTDSRELAEEYAEEDEGVNHHPEVDIASYGNIQNIIDTADDVKLDSKNPARNPSILFIKQINPTGIVVVSFDDSENGRIVLHKSFFEKTKKGRFDKLPSKKNDANTSLMVGNPIISPVADATAAVRRISALNDNNTINHGNFFVKSDYSKIINENGAGVKAREDLAAQGFDGVNNEDQEFIAFDSNQIKSATDNTGEFGAGNRDIRYSIPQGVNARRENASPKYYETNFADNLKAVVAPGSKVRDNVFVSFTPDVFSRIGVTRLPMMMSPRHLRLNYYSREEFGRHFGKIRQGEHAHGLGIILHHIPSALEHPIAIIANMAEHATPGSVVAITDINIDGKKVVVPIEINVETTVDAQRIDSHLVLTIYDKNNWLNSLLMPAAEVEKQKDDRIGIFYLDTKKAGKYHALSGLEKGRVSSGVLHNIDDEGLPVKGFSKMQTDRFGCRMSHGTRWRLP